MLEQVDRLAIARPLRVTLSIDGLGCGEALMVERVIERVTGVTRVYVNPATEMAYIEYRPDRCGIDDLVAAVARAGFRANERDLHFHG